MTIKPKPRPRRRDGRPCAADQVFVYKIIQAWEQDEACALGGSYACYRGYVDDWLRRKTDDTELRMNLRDFMSGESLEP
jgi:hypothetical protein